MQREGTSDDRRAASRRDPPIIEGEAQELGPAPAADGAPAPDADEPQPIIDTPLEDAPMQDAIAAPPPRRRRSAGLIASVGLILIVGAGAVAWIAEPGHTPSDLRSKIAALLPESAQRGLGFAPEEIAGPKKEATAAPAAEERTTPAERPPAEAATPATEPAATAPTGAEAGRERPATGPESTPAAAASASEPTPGAGAMETAQGAPEAAAQTASLAARIDSLADRVAALEARLDQPKTGQRAPQERENAPSADLGAAAARVVVAQALTQALSSGRALDSEVSALRALGVSDDRLSEFSPYLQVAAPDAAQFAAQWTKLRRKIVSADAAPAGAGWTERLLDKARGLVKIEPVGAQSGSSAAAIYSRVEAALQRGDLATAAQTADTLPESAKAIVADWRAALMLRAKADAAAQDILSNSIAAFARPKS